MTTRVNKLLLLHTKTIHAALHYAVMNNDHCNFT